jgi:hypothetical protein
VRIRHYYPNAGAATALVIVVYTAGPLAHEAADTTNISTSKSYRRE